MGSVTQAPSPPSCRLRRCTAGFSSALRPSPWLASWAPSSSSVPLLRAPTLSGSPSTRANSIPTSPKDGRISAETTTMMNKIDDDDDESDGRNASGDKTKTRNKAAHILVNFLFNVPYQRYSSPVVVTRKSYANTNIQRFCLTFFLPPLLLKMSFFSL